MKVTSRQVLRRLILPVLQKLLKNFASLGNAMLFCLWSPSPKKPLDPASLCSSLMTPYNIPMLTTLTLVPQLNCMKVFPPNSISIYWLYHPQLLTRWAYSLTVLRYYKLIIVYSLLKGWTRSILIRGMAATMFDHKDLPPECFTQHSFSHSNLDQIKFLLGTTVDNNGKTTNPDFPPIIFEDNNPAIARGLFQNDILFKVVFHIYLTRYSYLKCSW